MTETDGTVRARLVELGLTLHGPHPPHDPLDAVVVHHHRIERVVRRMGPVQREAKLGQPGADLAFDHRM